MEFLYWISAYSLDFLRKIIFQRENDKEYCVFLFKNVPLLAFWASRRCLLRAKKKNDLKFSPALNITQKISKGRFCCHIPFAKLNINETFGVRDTDQHLSFLSAFQVFLFLQYFRLLSFHFQNHIIFIVSLYVMSNWFKNIIYIRIRSFYKAR